MANLSELVCKQGYAEVLDKVLAWANGRADIRAVILAGQLKGD